jgi:hypothetical protein
MMSLDAGYRATPAAACVNGKTTGLVAAMKGLRENYTVRERNPVPLGTSSDRWQCVKL